MADKGANESITCNFIPPAGAHFEEMWETGVKIEGLEVEDEAEIIDSILVDRDEAHEKEVQISKIQISLKKKKKIM